MLNIDHFRPGIQAICSDLSLKRLDIVGSATRADFDSASDVDVLVTFSGDERLLDRYFDLKERLEAIFKRPVDVIEERALKNPYLRTSLEKDRILIYGS